jgi:putative nucleotidyltransferase with HDIG domain
MEQGCSMKPDIRQKILSEHKELASLPQVISEVIRISRDPKTSIIDLSNVIKKDPNLTTRLLRIVNSPFYGPAQPITTINQAVMTMGVRAVVALALAASIYSMVRKVNTAVDRKKFWRHSLEVAMTSQAIAKALKYNSPEEAFVCGLLHDIGLLILESSFPEEVRRIWTLAETGESIIDLEQQSWGTDHARVGQFLLRQWGLPEVLSEAVGGHHLEFGSDDTHPYQKIILIVNLANRVSRFKVGNYPPPEARVIELKKTLLADLKMDESVLKEIERSIISDVVNESGFLEIDIGSTEELLKEANRLLYDQYLITENLLKENQQLKGSKIDSFDTKTSNLIKQCLSSISKLVKNRINVIKSIDARRKQLGKEDIISETLNSMNDTANYLNSIIAELETNIGVEAFNESQLINIKEKIDTRIKLLEESNIPV